MATFKAKITNIPKGVSEARIKEFLSTKAKVISIQMAGSSCTVEINSDALYARINRSSTKSMGLISFMALQSGSLGEFEAATISLI